MIISKTEVDAVLGKLASAFHSEAEFQFAFAWELSKLHPNARVMLEYTMDTSKWGFIEVDLVVEISGDSTAFEFKYKTKSLNTYSSLGLKHDLKNQGAINEGCYDYMKDIERLQELKNTEKSIDAGYAIFLTNDSSYWDKGNKTSVSSYVPFQFFEDPVSSPVTIKKGIHSWGNTRNGSKPKVGKERDNDIIFTKDYIQSWQDYQPGTSNPFRYFVAEI